MTVKLPLVFSAILLVFAAAHPAGRAARGFFSVKQIRANVDNRILSLCYGDTASLGTETDKNAFTVKCANRLDVRGDNKGRFVQAKFVVPMEPNTQSANAALEIVFDLVHSIVRDETDQVYSMDAVGKIIQEPIAKTITGNLMLNKQYYTIGELKITSVYCMDGTAGFRSKSLTLIISPAKKRG
jgi:hypothetical protein